MIPFQLLFYPPSLFKQHPVRHWRDVTLWLKWGIIVAIGSILLKVALLETPEKTSYLFNFLTYLARENDAITMGYTLKFGLFFLIEVFLTVMVWLIRSACLFISYNIIDASFTEGPIAMSIAGASLVNGLWILIPGIAGTIIAMLHGILLIAYLTSNINRLDLTQSLAVSILPGIIPFII
ncbi:MAG: hypothetical protein ABEK50_01915 [bacterium]